MTKDNNLYELFLKAIKEKIPHKTKQANFLADLLLIEKEAVYRRLRGEVPFSFIEIAKISRALNISIDGIIGINTPRSFPFQLKLTRHFDPEDVDYAMHEEYIKIVESIQYEKSSEVGHASGILPLHFSLKHELIQRFYALRSLYQFGDPGSTLPFSEIKFTERMKALFQQYLLAVEHFKYTFFIWDKSMITNLTNDIKYFHSIRLITDEEVQLLKKDIANFLDDLETLSIHGKYSNGNRVDIYVSSLNFEATYSYTQTCRFSLVSMKAFTLTETVSLDETVLDKMKKWFQALKRTSILISGSDERNRILFFEEQRDVLEKSL